MPKFILRPVPDWWGRVGVIIAGLALFATICSGAFAGAIWVIDHRISDKLLPLEKSLAAIEAHLGIQQPVVKEEE